MNPDFVAALQHVWGPGFLSPAGSADGLREYVGAFPFAQSEVLDFGCGLGGFSLLFVEAFGAARVTGVDRDAAATEQAARRAAERSLADRIEFLVHDGDRLALADARFDVAFAKEVLYYIADKPRVFRELYRVLRPGATLILIELMARDEEPGPLLREFCNLEDAFLPVRYETAAAHRSALGAAGFAPVTTRSATAAFLRQSRDEDRRLRTMTEQEIALMGVEWHRFMVENWRVLLEVLGSGELEVNTMFAVKPREHATP